MTLEAGRLEPETQESAPEAVPWPRMAVALLSLVGILVSGYLTLHRLGLIGRLYCGASGSCETVQASSYSAILGVPVAYVGLAGYLVILAVALAGLQPRWASDPRVPTALVTLSAVGVAFSVYLSVLEEFVIHAWCRWCIASAVVITLTLLFAIADLVITRRRAGGEGR